MLSEPGTSWLRCGGDTHHICPGALAVAWAQTRALLSVGEGAAVSGTRWWGCCRVRAAPPSWGQWTLHAELLACSPPQTRAAHRPSSPSSLRCRRVPAPHPRPSTAGRPLCSYPAPPTQNNRSWVEPGSRQVQSAVRGPLLLLDAPPSLRGAPVQTRGPGGRGLSPPTAHAAPVPRHAPDAGRLSVGSAACVTWRSRARIWGP